MIRTFHQNYSPLYFLASLGFGGMSVLFFMNLMHITAHPATPMPTVESISAAWVNGGIALQTVIALSYVGIAVFFLIHLALLVWNLRQFAAWRHTEAYRTTVTSNAEVTLLAIPLTLGMTINGLFVVGAVSVPGLWSVIEYLFPAALVAYLAVGLLALRMLGRYLNRVLHNGFDFKANGGLNQLLSAFSFAMVAVGFAAPAAMSHHTTTVVLGMLGSFFFGVISVLLFAVFLPLGVMSMLRYNLTLGNSATLWLGVPILTLWGITMLRLRHGVLTLDELDGSPAHSGGSIALFVMLAIFLMAQLVFLFLGHRAMATNGFYRRFVFSTQEQSPAAFTLVCPGVALGVLTFFFLHVGLVNNGIVEKFSLIYMVILAVAYVIQFLTIALMVVLVRNQLLRPSAAAATAVSTPAAEPVAAR